jgi:hypothetical protein
LHVTKTGRYVSFRDVDLISRGCVVIMSYFLGNDATSVNAFYFAGYSQPISWCFSLPQADVYTAIIVLTDVKPYKKGVRGYWRLDLRSQDIVCECLNLY